MSVEQSDLAALLVVLAAVMHAVWNSILKIKGERAIVVFLITGGAALGGLCAAAFLPFPARASWPYMAQSTVLHCGYLFTLSAAYQRIDLSVAYPIARGSAPAVVLLASLLFLNEQLHLTQIAGISLLVLGVLVLAWAPLRQSGAGPGVIYAALTACFIAGYSLNDGLGARLAGNAHSYAVWLFICQFVPVAVYVLARYRRGVGVALRAHWRLGLLGGLLSLCSYWIVIWAMTVISVPVAVALRESSVLFAMLIGVVWLRESWSLFKGAAVLLVLSGVLLIRF